MGFFDNFKSKKKDDFDFNSGTEAGLGEPPIDSHSTIDSMGDSNVFTSPADPNYGQPAALDPRMTMPLGESLSSRQNPIQQSFPQNNNNNNNNQNPLKQDFELISSKLDYLKASIEAVNQRLANLEHLVRQEQDKKKW